jgi:hypothetical protein
VQNLPKSDDDEILENLVHIDQERICGQSPWPQVQARSTVQWHEDPLLPVRD